jgi:hypothetical protein
MSKRILVVEDQPDSRQIIRDMLAPTDYEITESENGEEALAPLPPIVAGMIAAVARVLLLVLSGHPNCSAECLLLGGKTDIPSTNLDVRY